MVLNFGLSRVCALGVLRVRALGALRICALGVLLALLSGCTQTRFAIHSAKRMAGTAEDKPAGRYKIGKPYQIGGTWYYPKEDFDYDETGIASWYGAKFHGRHTANGEIYDMNTLTAAHRTLPMPSYVRVTNLGNGRSLVLKVNDRGPFAKGRIIDISRRGSQLLGFQKQGTAKVRVQILAAKSRTLAMRMKNQTGLAKAGSPITVNRLPKAKVNAQSLPPPGAPADRVVASSQPQAAMIKPAPVTGPTAPPVSAPSVSVAAIAPEPVNGRVSLNQVAASNIFVQVGAFGEHANANRTQARLASLGSVKISGVLVNGRDIYRVRVGPLGNVAAADRMLETVTQAGYPSARIIVE